MSHLQYLLAASPSNPEDARVTPQTTRVSPTTSPIVPATFLEHRSDSKEAGREGSTRAPCSAASKESARTWWRWCGQQGTTTFFPILARGSRLAEVSDCSRAGVIHRNESTVTTDRGKLTGGEVLTWRRVGTSLEASAQGEADVGRCTFTFFVMPLHFYCEASFKMCLSEKRSQSLSLTPSHLVELMSDLWCLRTSCASLKSLVVL